MRLPKLSVQSPSTHARVVLYGQSRSLELWITYKLPIDSKYWIVLEYTKAEAAPTNLGRRTDTSFSIAALLAWTTQLTKRLQINDCTMNKCHVHRFVDKSRSAAVTEFQDTSYQWGPADP